MIYNLVPCDHPILHTPTEEFDFTNPPIDPVELVNDMIETMAHNKGMGLAAPQVGLPYRMFVLWSQETLAVFNPRIVDSTTEEILLEEGCLSFPHLFVKIKRPRSIKVRFTDPFGNTRTEKFTGMTARCFLHELDHLNGIDYTRRATQFHLASAYRKQKNLSRQLKRAEKFAI